jgi:hypothetical protein
VGGVANGAIMLDVVLAKAWTHYPDGSLFLTPLAVHVAT